MEKEKIRAQFTVTVTETKEDLHTHITGTIDHDMDRLDRANIVYNVIKCLGITATDVMMWWIACTKE